MLYAMKTLRASSLAILASLVLASCMRMDLHMRFHSDDTIDVSMSMAMTEEWADPNHTGANPLYEEYQTPEARAELAEIEEQYGYHYDITEYRENGYIGLTMATNRMSLEDAMNTDPATSMGLNPQGMATFGREGEYFVYVVPREAVSEDEMFAEYDPALLADLLQFRVVVTFPGAIVEHNAGKVDGNTITFFLSDLFAPAEDIVVKAYAEDGRGLDEQGSTAVVLIIVGTVLAVAAVTVAIVAARRRGAPTGEWEAPETQAKPEG
jgi:hypothetical protein